MDASHSINVPIVIKLSAEKEAWRNMIRSRSKPFQCGTCGKCGRVSVSSSHLEKHVLTHNGSLQKKLSPKLGTYAEQGGGYDWMVRLSQPAYFIEV
jgi:hypothetical protein